MIDRQLVGRGRLKGDEMAKAYSFASWNVEHFNGDPSRVERVVTLLQAKNPDVFAIYEVQGKAVFDALMELMETHQFSITENPRSGMEILIGVRRSIPAFVTQREEFQSKVPTLRPGALVTLRKNDKNYPILFLHVKSLTDPRAWGLRDDMFSHVAKLKRVLDKQAGEGERAPFVVLGDLNTMGLNAPYNEKSDLTGDEEITSLTKRFSRVNMRPLTKSEELTWWNGKEEYDPGSKLDHVFADKTLTFKTFNGNEVQVLGWPEETTKAKKRAWINKHSDHALLYGELQT